MVENVPISWFAKKAFKNKKNLKSRTDACLGNFIVLFDVWSTSKVIEKLTKLFDSSVYLQDITISLVQMSVNAISTPKISNLHILN